METTIAGSDHSYPQLMIRWYNKANNNNNKESILVHGKT